MKGGSGPDSVKTLSKKVFFSLVGSLLGYNQTTSNKQKWQVLDDRNHPLKFIIKKPCLMKRFISNLLGGISHFQKVHSH